MKSRNHVKERRGVQRRPGGFTFVEVLTALLFMAIVLPIALGAITLANRAAVVAERKAIASQLADSYLREMLIDESWSVLPGAGNFTGEHRGYSWELDTSTWEYDSMVYLELRVLFIVQGRRHSVRLAALAEEPTI